MGPAGTTCRPPLAGGSAERGEDRALSAASDLERALAELGFQLSAEERAIVEDRVAAQLEAMRGLLEWTPPGAAAEPAARPATGRRPSPEEDPWNALLWSCRIEGAGGGPLAGTTVTLKDNIAVAGVPLTCGSRLLEDFRPAADSSVATRLLAAGAVITGKANLDTFAGLGAGLGGISDYGPVLNPHDRRHLTGGSSSGSGAAVAAGVCDLSIGGDQGGSIRIPAAWCGVIGLKPSFGLVPHTGVLVGGNPGIDHVGPLARSTALVAAALEAIAGPDGLDPRQAGVAQARRGYAAELAGGAVGLRIGLLEEGIAEPVQPAVREAVLSALDVLAAEGAEVGTISVPEHVQAPLAARALNLEGSLLNYGADFGGAFARTAYPEDAIAAVAGIRESARDRLPAGLRLRYLTAAVTRRRFAGTLYARAQNLRPAFVHAYDSALSKVDVLAMPTVTTTAPATAEAAGIPVSLAETFGGGRAAPVYRAVIRNCSPFNYTGHPALSLPCAKDGRLPIGLQLVARRFEEGVLLRAAAAFERATDWQALVTPGPAAEG